MPAVTDPIVLEDINAALALRVYEAVRDAEAQQAGLLPPPPASRAARVVLRRAQLGTGHHRPGCMTLAGHRG